jgi:hypothetical protein
LQLQLQKKKIKKERVRVCQLAATRQKQKIINDIEKSYIEFERVREKEENKIK